MITDQRNAFGFPVPDKLQAAQQYAAAARQRNEPPCQCVTCKQIDMLPGVQRIVANWK